MAGDCITGILVSLVLEPMISMLSDPDHLNQWVVGLLAEAELNPPQEDERADETQ